MSLTRYDTIADWYDKTVRTSSIVSDLILEPVLSLLGNTQNQTICDVACGQGRLARLLAEQGAQQVIGVDISTNLIKIAQREEASQPLGVRYQIDNAEKLTTLADQLFDQAICYLALMDITDLSATFQAINRILKPAGLFTFVITHPCFQTPHATTIIKSDNTLVREVKDYFLETYWCSSNPNGMRGKVGAHHRTLSTYLNSLIAMGFQITTVVEPEPNADLSKQRPEYSIVPPFIIIQAKKVFTPSSH